MRFPFSIVAVAGAITLFGCPESPISPGPDAGGEEVGYDAGPQPGQDGGLDGGLDAGQALVRLKMRSVQHCPVDPPRPPGLATGTPTAAKIGLVGVELLRDRTDAAPVRLTVGSTPLALDLILGGEIASWVPAGSYKLIRYSLAWASVTVPAAAHLGSFTVPGTFELDVATANHVAPTGGARVAGGLIARFTGAGTSFSQTATAPLDCPLSAAGGLVETGGGSHLITVPVPGGTLVVAGGEAERVLTANFPLSDAVTWLDRSDPGFAVGVLDLVQSPTGSEAPARLPICDLLMSDRCESTATPPRTEPAWPMPDSATTACTDAATVAACPASGQSGYGQDGTSSVHPAQYLVLGDTVRDLVTGLLWQRSPDLRSFDWWASHEYCEALSLGGREDWSLPSRLELVSLLDVGRAGPSIDLASFPDAPTDFFWTSSPAMFSSLAFGVRFDQGFVYDHDPRVSGRVRCVADGKQPPSPRYVSLTSTVRDQATGLIWQKGVQSARTWLDALAGCDQLALAGATDWRLPTLKELLTLVDEYALNPSTDVGAFPATPPEWLWTSTPGFAPSNYAQTVSFTDGFCTPAATQQLYVSRCVRWP